MDIEPTITIGGIVNILAGVGGIAGLGAMLRKMRRENEADFRQRTDEIRQEQRDQAEEMKAEVRRYQSTTSERLARLEERTADFVPRPEIEKSFSSEAITRSAQIEAGRMADERLHESVTALRIAFGKLEQQQATAAADGAETKLLIKELARDTGQRFDRMQGSLNEISRKVA